MHKIFSKASIWARVPLRIKVILKLLFSTDERNNIQVGRLTIKKNESEKYLIGNQLIKREFRISISPKILILNYKIQLGLN